MFLNVDLIGADAVINCLQQSNLKRFVIYRQGQAHGATPVYDCSYTQSNAAAVKTFKDWASNILQFNPNNFLCYDLLCFDDYENNQETDKSNNLKNLPKNPSGKKTGKMRVSFALNSGAMQNNNNAPQMNNAPHIDIAGEIQKGVDMAMLRFENKQLKEQIAELESDDDDDESGDDIVSKVTGMINALNGVKDDHAIMNGDDIKESITEIKNIHGLTPAELKIKNLNIKKAVNILFKHNKNLDIDLLKLANMAETNKIVFDMVIEKLRSF